MVIKMISIVLLVSPDLGLALSECKHRRRLIPCLKSKLNLQATKLFIVTPATKGWVVTTPTGFRVRFKILYRVIQPLIQHCLLHKMVYLNIIYVIATRNYDFFTTGIFRN